MSDILRAGVLCNPLSGRVKKKSQAVRAAAANLPNSIYREATDLSGFRTVLNEFAEAGVGLLVIIGGDGTFHAVLSHILGKQVFHVMPVISLIPAGTTNMTAYDMRIKGKPVKLLRRLATRLQAPRSDKLLKKPVLKVEQPDTLTLHGMFFGVGIIVDGVKFFKERIQRTGVTGEGASGLVIIRYLLELLFNRSSQASYGLSLSVSEDGGEWKNGHYLVLFASALDRLLVGIKPYWGEQAAPMHMLALNRSPRALWRALLPLLSGRGNRLQEVDGYYSRNLDELTIQMDGDFIIDGEIYTVSRDNGPVRITIQDTIEVLVI